MPFRFKPQEFAQEYTHAVALPSYTVWNRLEVIPFSDDIGRSLAAEIRDPLWMLGRQWQVGEFQAEDAGAPLLARTAWHETALATVRAGADDVTTSLDDAAPVEARVEAEPLADLLSLGLRIGALWMAGLTRDPTLAGADAWFRTHFAPDAPAAAGQPATLRDAREAANRGRQEWLRTATRRGLVDGLALLNWLRAGLPDGPADIDAAALAAYGERFLAAHDAQFVPPAARGLYDRERFEYRFALETGGATPDRLNAGEYDGIRLDWSSFDRNVGAGAPDGPAKTGRFLPQPVSFPGMPVERWWEFEDRRVDLGAVMAGRTDLAKLLMVEFGLVYGNDWFVVPVDTEVGAVLRVQGVVVTDDFGDETFVPADDALIEGEGAAASTLFALVDEASGALPRESLLVVPPVSVTPVEGPPLDRVHLLRDEMANMAWAVEQVVPDRLGGGMDARAAAARVRGLSGDAEEEPPQEERFHSDAGIRWRLRTQVPDTWIPFVPVHRENDRRRICLQQAAMPWIGPSWPLAKILPQGRILASQNSELPLFICDEEVPRAGAIVERAFTRVRWLDGRTCVWIGRSKRNGRGPGSSGLAFDGLVDRPRDE